jgi:hypothetical protein
MPALADCINRQAVAPVFAYVDESGSFRKLAYTPSVRPGAEVMASVLSENKTRTNLVIGWWGSS